MSESTCICMFFFKDCLQTESVVGKIVLLLFSWNIVFAEKSGCIFSSFLVVQLMASQANRAHHLD